MSPGERWRRRALAAVAAVHLLVSIFGVAPGHLLIDEAVYHLTVRDLVATGGWGLRTGWTELPSPELVHSFLSVHGGRVVSPYPWLFPSVAAPFYALMGFRGLFAVNALAFVGVAWLVHALARRLSRDPLLALDATLLFALGTFAWEYSQAAWPHMLALLFTTGAMLLAVAAIQATGVRAAAKALAAGLVAGLAPGVRLDAAVALPCVLAALLFARPARLRDASLALVGAAPGLALLAWTNLLKFGSANPLSYGNPFGEVMRSLYLPVAAAGALGLAAAWALTRERVWRGVAPRGRALAMGLAGVALALLAFPAVRTAVQRLWAVIVDLSAIRADRLSEWVPRSAGGGVVYLDTQKHALLQSLPYLTVLAVLLLRPRDRVGRDAGALGLLALLPAATVAQVAPWGYDGGLCLNVRLLLPALPFLAILTAYAVRELAARWDGGPGPATVAAAAGAAAVAYLALARFADGSPDRLELPMLRVPLLLAGGLLALLAGGEWLRGRAGSAARRGAWSALAAAVTWACLVALLHDYPHHWKRRAENWAVGERALALVPAGALFLTSDFPDPFMRLVEMDGVMLAFPYEDGLRDLPRLLALAFQGRHRVFAALRPAQWTALAGTALRGLPVAQTWNLDGNFVMAEILPPPGPP